MIWMMTFAKAPPKNPNNDPIAARIESWVDRFCINSTRSTATNGTIIIPNGGITNEPIITATAAIRSPHLLPPYFFTK